jgi:uncharacterized protein YecE (DUF72 family)
MPPPPAVVLLGAQGFSAKDWIGTFYPPHFSSNQFLPFYSRVYDTVEINSTSYAIPSRSTVSSWAQRTPPHFVFACKMPQDITHDHRLRAVEEKLDLFLDHVRILQGKLGPVVMQFPRSFTRRYESSLRSFLPLLPRDVRFVAEFRSVSWHEEGVLDLLRGFNVAWCINDWQDLPPVVATTTDFAYLRLVGYHREFEYLGEVQRDRSEDLTRWASTIEDLATRVPHIYVYVNNHYAGHAPATVNQLARLLLARRVPPRPVAGADALVRGRDGVSRSLLSLDSSSDEPTLRRG